MVTRIHKRPYRSFDRRATAPTAARGEIATQHDPRIVPMH